MTIPALIIKTIVERKARKIALRYAQRKLEINKFQSLVRRFDKRKTFVENLKKQPIKMFEKMFKQYLKRKFYGLVVPARFVRNWRKYGIAQAMKRILFKTTPTELKIPYYFLKDVKDKYEKVQLITLGKKLFWEEINKLEQKQQAKILKHIVDFKPHNQTLKEYWYEVLDKEFMFYANSRMTGNFEQLPCVYNISQMYLMLPIRGFGGKMIKTYRFENIPWNLIYPAMKGADFGKNIYSQFRSATADYYGKYWANLDPHYKR